MTNPITIESFEVAGFRAYLEPQTFALNTSKRRKSLVVYAPNATGKSSLVDAFEFYFSKRGSLERLGQRKSQTQAGPTAMEHVGAKSKAITGRVGFKFKHGSDLFEDDRTLVSPAERPDAAQRVIDATKVRFVIRGYDLRRFVEASAEDRYSEMAQWFALDPLVNIQKNLRSLQRTVKTKSESEAPINERLRDLKRLTDDQVTEWDEEVICRWFNSNVLNQLDPSLTFNKLSETDPAYIALGEANQKEQESLGLAALNRIMADTEAILGNDDQNALPEEFESSVAEFDTAVKLEVKERDAASQSIFNDIWKSAGALFGIEDLQLDGCPVCETRFEDTPHGSCGAVKIRIQTRLSTLQNYHTAQNNLKKTTTAVNQRKRNLMDGIERLQLRMTEGGITEDLAFTEYSAKVKDWSIGEEAPISKGFANALNTNHASLKNAKSEIELKQGDNTYANAHDTARRLIRLKGDVEIIFRERDHLSQLHSQLTDQIQSIEDRINDHIRKLVEGLQDEVNRLYKKMQHPVVPDPPTVRFWLSADPSKNQQQVRLSVNFAPGHTNVAPTGYLSDSQIHSVAIALRLVAIRTFNKGAPIVVLDDIVTSYDADHRKSIASMIAEDLEEFQVILVTHDEQFFLLLKDHLPDSQFEFRRITKIDSGYGPVFSNYRTPDAVVGTKLADGDSAGEEIRKVEEEWLLKICREFVVDVAIRPVDRPFQYDRNELAAALQRFLKDRKLSPPQVPGITNKFLVSLGQGQVENLASHFSDNPNQWNSSGDERTRWAEFKYFRDMFVCSDCGKDRFKRPYGMVLPVCWSCETTFDFETNENSHLVGDAAQNSSS